jgi:folylpolyglutamate synthase/dihydropteroate synthase
MPVTELESIAKEGLGQEVESISDFKLALGRAKQRALEIDGTVVVTGSITLVGDVIKLIQEDSDEE